MEHSSMVQQECSCGFRCNTRKALYLHAIEFPDHRLLIPPSTPVSGLQLQLHEHTESAPTLGGHTQESRFSARVGFKEMALQQGKADQARCTPPRTNVFTASTPLNFAARVHRRKASSPDAARRMVSTPDMPLQHDEAFAFKRTPSKTLETERGAPSPKCRALHSSPLISRLIQETPPGKDAPPEWSPHAASSAPAEFSPMAANGTQEFGMDMSGASGQNSATFNAVLGPAPDRKPRKPVPAFGGSIRVAPPPSTPPKRDAGYQPVSPPAEFCRLTAAGVGGQSGSGNATHSVQALSQRTMTRFVSIDSSGQPIAASSFQQQAMPVHASAFKVYRGADGLARASQSATLSRHIAADAQPTPSDSAAKLEYASEQCALVSNSDGLPSARRLAEGDASGQSVAELRRVFEAKNPPANQASCRTPPMPFVRPLSSYTPPVAPNVPLGGMRTPPVAASVPAPPGAPFVSPRSVPGVQIQTAVPRSVPRPQVIRSCQTPQCSPTPLASPSSSSTAPAPAPCPAPGVARPPVPSRSAPNLQNTGVRAAVAHYVETAMRVVAPPALTERRGDGEDSPTDADTNPLAGSSETSRSSTSSPDQQTSKAPRQSRGLIVNPGSSTVDLLGATQRNVHVQGRRFSYSKGRGGEQVLVPVEGDHAAQVKRMKEPFTISVQQRIQRYQSGHPVPPVPRPATAACVVPQAKVARKPPTGVQVGGLRYVAPQVETLENFSEETMRPATTEMIGELFNRYVSAESVKVTLNTFWQLLFRCGREFAIQAYADHTGAEPPHRLISRLNGLPWRAQYVWDIFDRRTRLPEYTAAPLAGKKAVVCGAGPVGVRAALELALLGAQVDVVEKRTAAEACGRINRIHLWPWCKQDLCAWGAKIFDPPGGTFGGDNDFCHIGIGELQLLLIKNALLLGVQFYFSCSAEKLENGSLLCANNTKLPCDFLFVADGANSTLSTKLGMKSMVTGLCGKGSAIGVVANFTNSKDPQQMALRQFAWARQFNMPLFNKLKVDTSVDLENIVYYKGQAHHYMVMTPTKRSLVEFGVLRDGKPEERRNLLHWSNVNIDKLNAMVQSIAAFFKMPTELSESQGAMIFDFSGIRRLENAATAVDGVFVCAVGDALLEPFWPEGLGIMRGFLSALDAAHAAVTFATDTNPKTAIEQTTETYKILKSVAAQTASECLQRDSTQYRLSPASRYILKPSWLPEKSTAA